jgi:amino acid transporter
MERADSEPDAKPPEQPASTSLDLERYGRYRVPRRRTPLIPDLELHEVHKGQKPGSRYVRLVPRTERPFQRLGRPDLLLATEVAIRPRDSMEALWRQLKRVLVGAPLASARLAHERLSKAKALAVFSSDNLSSSAYATEEILLVLILAGTGALKFSIPIAVAIAALVTIVATSYRQTIRAYPSGGGAYIVAKDNLGTLPGLVAGASLLVDYTLTVAVSVAAGVAAITSAAPALGNERVILGVVFVAALTLGNLRGIRESGTLFAIPAYIFIASFAAMLVTGLVRLLIDSDLHVAAPPNAVAAGTQGVGLFLILRAFASGSAALTGIEAISNGVPNFKPPEAKNAAAVLVWMALILTVFFVGLTALVHQLNVAPSETKTVVAQVTETVFGKTPLFYIVQAATAMILVLAANTSFNGLPVLASVMAKDRFLPRQFSFRGDRLAFSYGIVALGAGSAGLLIAFGGQTHRLIPLYAVGVFTGFTLSQLGMVLHWRRTRERGWARALVINGVGAVATGVVAVIITGTKFVAGAWITILGIAFLTYLLFAIRRHYDSVNERLEVRATAAEPASLQEATEYSQAVLVPVDELNEAVHRTVQYARSISENVTALHVSDSMEEAEGLRQRWEELLPDVPLVVIESPYRSFIAPILAYIDALDRSRPGEIITVALPEFVPEHFWQGTLHNQSAIPLKRALLSRANTVVIGVPYHLKK